MESVEAGTSGRALAQARKAIEFLGPFAAAPVSPSSLAWFGHWLEWPAWVRDGTSLPPDAGPLPDRITAADDLIITANIIDRGHADDMLARVANGPALATGALTMMASAHAPTLGDFVRLLPRLGAPSFWVAHADVALAAMGLPHQARITGRARSARLRQGPPAGRAP